VTWGEAQLISLQMMSIDQAKNITDLAALRQDDDASFLLSRMPAAANDGMMRMAATGGLVRSRRFAQSVARNLTPEGEAEFAYDLQERIFSAPGARAYYFEVTDGGQVFVEIERDGAYVLLDAISCMSAMGSYTVYKNTVANPDGEIVRLRFAGDKPYGFRNIALYPYAYESDQEIPACGAYIRWSLPEIISDYMNLLPGGIVPEQKNAKYTVEGDELVLARGDTGGYLIRYEAYPQKVTESTADAQRLDLPEEYAVLLPSYIASALYKEADITTATMLRNEFEAGLQGIRRAKPTPQRVQNTTGWW
jgi:hypothetical protein